MIETVTLDQLRVFLAIVDSGSFTAASRQLERSQSAVSHAVAQLEAHLQIRLFDRRSSRPVLTTAGRAVAVDAREVIGRMQGLRARASGLSRGLEAEVSIALSVMLPMRAVTQAFGSFRLEFPSVALRLYVEALGGVVARVLDGECRIGITGTMPSTRLPETLGAEAAGLVDQIAVISPEHPLADAPSPASEEALRAHVQLVLTDRSSLTLGNDVGVAAPETWRIADLSAKHALLLAGLGWGALPAHMVEDDLAEGRLLPLRRAAAPEKTAYRVPLFAIYRRDEPPGPAGRWLLDRLKIGEGTAVGGRIS